MGREKVRREREQKAKKAEKRDRRRRPAWRERLAEEMWRKINR